MNISKIGIMLLVFSLMLSPVLAQETDELNDTDEKEVKEMVNPLGAEVRLLQLEYSITKNLLLGTTVVEIIEKNNLDFDASELNEILDKLEALIVEVQNVPREGTHSELAEQFVHIKKDSINLTKEFRDAAREVITAEEKTEIREAFANSDKSVLEEIKEKIKQARRELNSHKIEILLEKRGATNPELVEKIRNGEANLGEVKKIIKEEFAALTPEQKKDAVSKVKENARKRGVNNKDAYSKIGKDFARKRISRHDFVLRRASDRQEQLGDRAKERGFHTVAERLGANSGKLDQFRDRLMQMRKNIRPIQGSE